LTSLFPLYVPHATGWREINADLINLHHKMRELGIPAHIRLRAYRHPTQRTCWTG
jgi:hypothetical protein